MYLYRDCILDFQREFYSKVKELYPGKLEWQLVGILVNDQRVYTLSYDSKILSGLFEIFAEPIVRNNADKFNLVLEKSKQNQYPDFTLFSPSSPQNKIAVEVKSTYRQYTNWGDLKNFGFTLGSYRSFLRDPVGKKGILYPYKDYIEHWIIGFLYTRNPKCKRAEIRQIIEAAILESPFNDIEFFVQEKYKIAGKSAGSGNTTNIGSIKSKEIEDFVNGSGPFKSHKEFEEYWRGFKNKKLTNNWIIVNLKTSVQTV